MINIGFIGLGIMGRSQVASFAQLRGCKVVAGCDVSDEARRRFGREYPRAQVYDDLKDLLADTDVDAVVVALPTFHHERVGIDILRSGRPVLMEKPLARSVAAANRMIEASEKAGQLLMVAHCRRFDPDWGAMAKQVQQNKIGRPILWRSISAGPGRDGWFIDEKLGGGPLFDQAVHDYDFANHLFGNPEHLLASAVKTHPQLTAVNCGTVIVRYAAGDQLLVSRATRVARGAGAFDLVGPLATMTPGTSKLEPSADPDVYGFWTLTEPAGKQRLVRYRRHDMLVNQARHFLDCIDKKTECRSPATEAIKAVAVGEAVLRACRRGGGSKVQW